ncbi:MAG: hypothetical protein NZ570_06340 [Candidatus Caldarchaeum sp.]|nr:hypothetical protein [Candidatus Caldarchaeum sp.]MCS7137565.1 hypothetical protein [Candidatus Caldarchaeum sp.]MDW7977850.1 hypothetical protein [Candidatus Caldarchaeum sp.]MDW8360067.1 hypothetical protein [Candidatus Caldarchaeum sp.]
MDCSEGHDYVYHGALNIYMKNELLKVVEAWRCRRCGIMRVGLRGPEVLGSTEGMLPEPEPSKHWVVLVCKAGEEPVFDVLQVGDSQQLDHRCPALKRDIALYYVRAKGVFDGLDGAPAEMHFVYELGKTLRGYLELAKTPPEVVSLIR